jgi:hypothetical protein
LASYSAFISIYWHLLILVHLSYSTRHSTHCAAECSTIEM